MSVQWSDMASDQMLSIRDYIAPSSPGYAQAIVGRIVRRAEGLASQPFIGAEVPEYGMRHIREVFEHPYRIIYRADDQDVLIVAVIHSARRLPRMPPN